MPRQFMAVMVALVVLLGSAPFQHGLAAKSPQPDPTVAVDYQAYAERNGVSVSDAIAQMNEVALISALQEKLQQELPESFAGLWIDHSPYGVTIATTEAADSSSIDTMVASARLSVAPRIVHVARSLQDLAALDATVARIALPKHDREIDVRANTLVLYTTDQVELDRGLAAADLTGEGASTEGSVTVVELAELSEPATGIYGGLGGSNNGWIGCPSAFVVRRLEDHGQYTYGVSTAGHCGESPYSYQGVTLPYMGQCLGGTCDSQWHTVASFTPYPQFIYYSNQAKRYVTATVSRSSQVVGQQVCKYGPVTFYVCGTLMSKGYAPSWIPNGSPVFLRAMTCNYDMVDLGDSGGPVFDGTRALGITSGKFQDLNCHKQLIYGAIDYSVGPLGVSVWVSP